MKNAALFILLSLVGCSCPVPPLKLDAPPREAPAASQATSPLLVVKNECGYPIWIQQQGMPSPTLDVRQIRRGGSITYEIPAVGLPSTRFWVKTGCDSDGNNCTIGQSSPPCPAAGCTPPIDSKIEATWGCALPEAQCGLTPQGKTLHGPTWWNSSAVDGYTLPYTIEVGANGGPGCSNVLCNELAQSQCPSNEDLSDNGQYPSLKSVDLHVYGPKPDGGAAPMLGCYSTCQALTQVGYGGKGYQPPSDPHAAMYCCPTPPISSAACKAGPVVKTKYVRAVHAMCHDTAYAFAYDDGVGLHTCTASTVLTMTYCPPQPAAK